MASGCGHKDAAGLAGFGLPADKDFHVLAQGIEEAHQPLDGKTLKLIIGERRNLGLIDLQQVCRIGLRETALFENLADGDRETHLGMLLCCARQAEIGQHIARAGGHSAIIFCFRHSASRNPGVPFEDAARPFPRRASPTPPRGAASRPERF